MVTTQIKIKQHLVEYLHAIFKPDEKKIISFPMDEDIAITISNLIQKRRTDVEEKGGNLTIEIPHRSWGKNPHYYDHISVEGQRILECKIEDLFWAHVHEFVDQRVHAHGDQLKDAVFIFMTKHDIQSISSDAIAKSYYRWRFKINRKRRKRKYAFK